MHHLKRKGNSMTGCFGNHPEDRAMENELHAHLDKDIEQERMKELAESYMQDGEDYYPFQPDNLGEAFAEMGDTQIKLLSATIESAAEMGLKNDHANHLALAMLTKFVHDYWHKYAIMRIEKSRSNAGLGSAKGEK